MQVKMLTSVAGINFDHHIHEIVEVDDAEAAHWIEAGFAIEVPAGEASAEQIHDLTKRLAEAAASRDALAAQKADLEGKLAAAIAEKKGAQAEAAILRKAAADARAGLEKERAAKKPEPPAEG